MPSEGPSEHEGRAVDGGCACLQDGVRQAAAADSRLGLGIAQRTQLARRATS
jgi:hypothetical protein